MVRNTPLMPLIQCTGPLKQEASIRLDVSLAVPKDLSFAYMRLSIFSNLVNV